MKKVFAGENCGREAAVYLGRAGKNRYFGWTGPLQKNCPTALLGRAAFAAYERFAGGKTSAEGWLCHPEHLNHRRAERALGPRSPKRKTRYKRVFLFGKALQSRYFKFSIRHLDILPNGPSGPRCFCGVRAFCRRQNLGGGMALPSRAFESPKGGDRLRRSEPKTKGHPFGCPFVLVEAGRVELPSENPSMGTSPGADGYCGSLALPVPVTLGKPSRPGVW